MNFWEIGGFTNLVLTTEKSQKKLLADENRNFFGEKVYMQKISTESEKCSEIGRKSETEGNASLPLGGWTPLKPDNIKQPNAIN